MKRHGNLYEKIISIENLREAAATAAKANGRSRAVDDFYKNEEGNLQRLHQSLVDFSFRPSRPSTFTVHEPKERTITTAPFYPDKIVEQAIVQVIEPILYPVFTYTSYGSIKKKGCLRLSQDVRNALDTDRHGRPIDIAGYVIYLNQTRLRKRIKQRLCRKLAVLRRCHIGRTAFLQAVAPWWGWLLSTDSSFLLNKLQTLSPYEIQFKNTSRAAA